VHRVPGESQIQGIIKCCGEGPGRFAEWFLRLVLETARLAECDASKNGGMEAAEMAARLTELF